jgi:FKBP-type peptidyl-prolyl cis-trans isomerase FklB
MKKILITIVAISGVLIIASCGSKNSKIDLKDNKDSVAYVIGVNIGKNLSDNIKRDSLNFNPVALAQGFKDAIEGKDSLYFTNAEKQKIMMAFQKEMQTKQMEKQSKLAEPNKIAGNKFLEENKTKEGVKVTASGLQYKVIKEGKGKTPTANDKVTVNYEGKLIDGKIFDSSYDRKKPETFPVTGVIKGWTEGLQLMKEGCSYELYVPSDLAYGDAGNSSIPGGSTLIFKVELLKVEPAATENPQKENNANPKKGIQKKTK